MEAIPSGVRLPLLLAIILVVAAAQTRTRQPTDPSSIRPHTPVSAQERAPEWSLISVSGSHALVVDDSTNPSRLTLFDRRGSTIGHWVGAGESSRIICERCPTTTVAIGGGTWQRSSDGTWHEVRDWLGMTGNSTDTADGGITLATADRRHSVKTRGPDWPVGAQLQPLVVRAPNYTRQAPTTASIGSIRRVATHRWLQVIGDPDPTRDTIDLAELGDDGRRTLRSVPGDSRVTAFACAVADASRARAALVTRAGYLELLRFPDGIHGPVEHVRVHGPYNECVVDGGGTTLWAQVSLGAPFVEVERLEDGHLAWKRSLRVDLRSGASATVLDNHEPRLMTTMTFGRPVTISLATGRARQLPLFAALDVEQADDGTWWMLRFDGKAQVTDLGEGGS